MFETYRRVSHPGEKHLKYPPTINVPAKVKDLYLKIAFAGRNSKDGYVRIVGDEETGILLVIPPSAEDVVEKVGLENIGKLLVRKNEGRKNR